MAHILPKTERLSDVLDGLFK